MNSMHNHHIRSSGTTQVRTGPRRQKMISAKRWTSYLALLVLAGCATLAQTVHSPGLAFAQTPGEYFREYLRQKHKECEKLELGPYLPSDVSPTSRRRADTTCKILTLKPWQPGDSPESAFAHSLKLPPPHDVMPDPYQPGMSPNDYFLALCSRYAGEFVFRRVEGVSAIRDLRPRSRPSDELFGHLTAFEDPATYPSWSNDSGMALSSPNLYRQVEKMHQDRWYAVSSEEERGRLNLKWVPVPAPTAKYEFTWRGIYNVRHLEHGIAGGELLILDGTTREVLAFKRSFRFRWAGRYPSEQKYQSTGFGTGSLCPSEVSLVRSRMHRDLRDFLVSVLIPTPNASETSR